ncbi:hypothetical protein E2562_005134 [Oryza meyeriana var. granulata]|uniref:Uncharacterized protein n=1 Tax=Oryza meyeriana var. granulata TaxID=110450 RepID=A0A6G1BTH0_9ORYZ|nr:hypothetical protein E2562_005134 [Oryza meyeriana var. granulata]
MVALTHGRVPSSAAKDMSQYVLDVEMESADGLMGTEGVGGECVRGCQTPLLLSAIATGLLRWYHQLVEARIVNLAPVVATSPRTSAQEGEEENRGRAGANWVGSLWWSGERGWEEGYTSIGGVGGATARGGGPCGGGGGAIAARRSQVRDNRQWWRRLFVVAGGRRRLWRSV